MGRNVLLLEATDRYGGRIETGDLSPPPIAGDAPHKAEFGPMRFELEIQPLFAQLLDDFKIATEPFSAPSSPEPPVEYPLAQDERAADGTPLSSLALLKLGVFRMFDQDPFVGKDKDGKPTVELPKVGRDWLDGLSDAGGGFDRLRQDAPMPGTRQPLYQHGFWNALYTQLSPMAVAKILHFGTFYHLMPDNPNAVEWAIFWLRLFQLGDKKLSTIPTGVQTVSDALLHQLGVTASVELRLDCPVVAVRPAADGRGVEVGVDVRGGETYVADHAVLALPKQPLLELAGQFPDRIRKHLNSVIGFTLLKVFCVTETPEWWITEPPKAQEGAWNAPTREIHYLPAKADDDTHWGAPETTLVLLYTDRPAAAFWQPYLQQPAFHRRAEVGGNPDLEGTVAGVLFNLHWEWAKNVAGIGDRTGRDALSTPRGRRIALGLGEFWAGVFADLPVDDPAWQVLAARFPGLVGNPGRILFRPDEVLDWQRNAIGDYAIRDWSRPPFGAGCHAWAPGARSWEVRADLASFGFRGHEAHECLHVCGEAYSDYQGFIEGALRSTLDAVGAIR